MKLSHEPIVLFQAQPRNEEVTVEGLKMHLIEFEQIPEEAVKLYDNSLPTEGMLVFQPPVN